MQTFGIRFWSGVSTLAVLAVVLGALIEGPHPLRFMLVALGGGLHYVAMMEIFQAIEALQQNRGRDFPGGPDGGERAHGGMLPRGTTYYVGDRGAEIFPFPKKAA